MPRPIKQIEIFLPLDYNDGRPIESRKFNRLEDQLLTRFGGVTSNPRFYPLRGVWKGQRQVYQDRVVVFTVLVSLLQTEFRLYLYLERLKERLKRSFDQLEVLITVSDLVAI